MTFTVAIALPPWMPPTLVCLAVVGAFFLALATVAGRADRQIEKAKKEVEL